MLFYRDAGIKDYLRLSELIGLDWIGLDCRRHCDRGVKTEAMCLGVLLDSALTFAPHVRRLSSRNFHHRRQMMILQKSLTQDAAN